MVRINRFYTGVQQRGFRNRNAFQRPVVVKKVVNKRRRKQNNNRSVGASSMSSKSRTYRFYIDSVKAGGLTIPVGPDKRYSATNYFVDSRSWNNYMVTSVKVEYNPLLNQTTAISMINAYFTNDTNAKIPDNDSDMKNLTVQHQGNEWFAANAVKFGLPVPVFKLNVYETGSGEGTETGSPFENCGNIFIKPTSLGDSTLVLGEVYLQVTVKFSAPAAPSLALGSRIYNGIAKDQWIQHSTDHNVFKSLFLSMYSKYFVYSNDDKHFFTTTSEPDAYTALKAINVDVKFTDNLDAGAVVATFDKTSGKWVDSSPSLQSCEVVNNIVPSKHSDIINPTLVDILKRLQAMSIPTYNKLPPVSEDEEDYDIDVPDVEDVHIADDFVVVKPSESPVAVTITNEPTVKIGDQPISVTQQKDSGEQIFDILKEVSMLVAAEE